MSHDFNPPKHQPIDTDINDLLDQLRDLCGDGRYTWDERRICVHDVMLEEIDKYIDNNHGDCEDRR